MGLLLTSLVQIDLPQAEEVEVIDKECTREHYRPPNKEEHPQDVTPCRIFNTPHHVRHRSPLPEKQDERKARKQNIGAALYGLGDEASPPFLEARSCHDAMLDG